MPEKLEGIFEISPYILQIVIEGKTTKSFPVAIVIPDFAWLRKDAKLEGTDREIAENKQTKEIISAEIARLCKEKALKGFEKPYDFHVG